MGILRDFERRLEGIVEGFFTTAFRSGLQPVELAKRLLREMEAGKTVGVKEIWVPNRYVFRLSREDHERLTGVEQGLARELAQVAMEGARERGFGLVARPEVTFEVDERLKRGSFRVEAEINEETGPPEPGEGALPGHAALVVVEGDSAKPQFALGDGPSVIGRLGGSDIELTDPGASRRHAEIRKEDGAFVLADLGSTNGTQVNGSTIARHTLREGDRITIGRTTLEFREG